MIDCCSFLLNTYTHGFNIQNCVLILFVDLSRVTKSPRWNRKVDIEQYINERIHISNVFKLLNDRNGELVVMNYLVGHKY